MYSLPYISSVVLPITIFFYQGLIYIKNKCSAKVGAKHQSTNQKYILEIHE